MKNFLKNSILVLVSIIFSLVLAELVIRWMEPEKTVGNDILAYIGTPGGDIDERGFRNNEALEQASIVVIGDSQTYGNNASLEEAWPQVYAGLVEEKMYQMAYGGYGPIQYRYLFDKAQELEPKKIIVAMYLGNDFYDAYNMACNKDYWKNYCGVGELENNVSQESKNVRMMILYGYDDDSIQMKILKLRQLIRKHSRLYGLLGNASRSLREKLGLAQKKEEVANRVNDWAENNDEAILFKYNDSSTILSPEYRLGAVSLDDPKTAEGFEVFKKTFAEMNDLATEKNIEFEVVIIPTKEIIYYNYSKQTEGTDLSGLDAYILKEEELLRNVEGFFDEDGIEYHLVLSDMVKALEDGGVLYNKGIDGHPNSAGYEVIAQSVYNFEQTKNIETETATTSLEKILEE
ncbi:hypothetical protein C0583_03840 [Candidatus Parcubacteria bacterium]|nr:MAG: hypothetical protein C0583_03840 [Candidatus Parcubacteria bacterium]